MSLEGDCIHDTRHVPPMIPDFNVHLLENAVPLLIDAVGDRFPLTFDREVNLCIAKGWSPWIVTYHGEPFIVCIDQIDSVETMRDAAKSNRIGFVPRRIIGSTTVIEIIDYKPHHDSADMANLARNVLLANDAGSCREQLMSMQNSPSMGNIVSESMGARDRGSNKNALSRQSSSEPLLQRMQRAYDLSRLATPQNENNVHSSIQQARKEHREDLRLFWFYDYTLSCQQDWIRDDSVCSMVMQPTNDEPTKTCIFLHGVGQADEDKGDPVSEFPGYWGDIHKYTPQCKERIFIREETKKRGWDSIELQESYCKIALSNQPEGDRLIRNKILYVHSMGNLILAAAIKNRICEIDLNTTTWYDIQGPFSGSKAASTLVEICLAVGSGWTKPVPALYYYIASKGGYCVPGTNMTYQAYHTLDPTYPGLESLYPIAAKRISGFLCGDSAIGLYSIYSPLLEILSLFVQYGENNDGMVPISSCNPGDADHNPDHRQPQYRGPVNHADGTCRNGDGRWGVDRKPCSYYAGRD